MKRVPHRSLEGPGRDAQACSHCMALVAMARPTVVKASSVLRDEQVNCVGCSRVLGNPVDPRSGGKLPPELPKLRGAVGSSSIKDDDRGE